ncbi:MAG: Acetylxylan esterase precursor, partial [Planctomycetota bacterium]
MMRNLIAVCLALGCLGSAWAADSPTAVVELPAAAPAETIRLWEGDAPGALGAADQDVPVLFWWPAPEAATGAPAIVICPGGGYGGLADHEGSDYARWLNSQGISGFVLRYRLGSKGYRHPVMLGDVARAIRLVRHEAERYGVDPERVGVMGSSAGGHLALTACLKGDDGAAEAADPIDRASSRPDLGVLCYPVVSMQPDKTHRGSRKNLLGESPDAELARSLSGELAAHAGMPPLFIWHTLDDQAVPVGPVLELVLRLKSLDR